MKRQTLGIDLKVNVSASGSTRWVVLPSSFINSLVSSTAGRRPFPIYFHPLLYCVDGVHCWPPNFSISSCYWPSPSSKPIARNPICFSNFPPRVGSSCYKASTSPFCSLYFNYVTSTPVCCLIKEARFLFQSVTPIINRSLAHWADVSWFSIV